MDCVGNPGTLLHVEVLRYTSENALERLDLVNVLRERGMNGSQNKPSWSAVQSKVEGNSRPSALMV